MKQWLESLSNNSDQNIDNQGDKSNEESDIIIDELDLKEKIKINVSDEGTNKFLDL